MYFNETQFRLDFQDSLGKQTLDKVSNEIEVPIFSLSRFQVGIVQNETVVDYYKVCKWMKKDPVYYIIDMSSFLPSDILTCEVPKDFDYVSFKKEVEGAFSGNRKETQYIQTIQTERRPIVVIKVPVVVSLEKIEKISDSPTVREMEREYHVIVLQDGKIESIEVQLVTATDLTPERYSSLMKEMEELNKLYSRDVKV